METRLVFFHFAANTLIELYFLTKGERQFWEKGNEKEHAMSKKIKIIGAGIAGLSAASYLQRNGYATEIYELHSVPGGFCTSWKKQGYTFDGCIHWLVGSSPSNPLYHSWNELLDMKALQFVETDCFARIDDDHGNSLTLYSDADRLGAELRRHASEHADTGIIDEMVNCIKIFGSNDNNNPNSNELKEAFQRKFLAINAEQFARTLQSPALESTLKLFIKNGPMFILIRLLSTFHQKSAGYPIGGSLNFARAIEKRYLELGGRINYNSKVVKILEKNNKAYGLKLESGKEVESDIIISAADGYYTIFTLLGGNHLNDTIKGFYASENPTLTPYASWVQISLGVKRSLEREPHELYFKATSPLVIDDKTKFETLNARIYNFDPTLAGSGHTVIIGFFDTADYRYWQDLRQNDREKYDREKSRIADEYIALLDNKLGNIKDRIEVIDVATPATAIRYTNSWHGSYMGWGWGTRVPVTIQRELPDLDNFYMTGQWITPSGGLPPVHRDGKAVARKICEKDGKEFKIVC
jgi:phytoene dehydrogenase-like protein